MKVLFDHQLFSYQRYGGASKYFAMMINSLPKNVWDTTTVFSNNEYVSTLELFKFHSFLPHKHFRGQGWFMNEINKPYTLYRLYKKDYDIFHQTHFDPYSLNAIGDKPMVTTFHDINYLTLNPNPRGVKWQRKSLERADRIIAISEYTKKDLLKYYSVDENKISVIYHGIQKSVVQLPLNRLVESPYILYVGSRDPHKNWKSLIKAFSLIKNRIKDIMLVCTFKNFSNDELQFISDNSLDGSVIQMSVTELQLYQLYRDALCFVFPSLYEGFGMPILESWINGCPVALSNCSCFPEIAQTAAVYFDPNDIGDIADKVEKVIIDTDYRGNLVNQGYLRVKNFSWEKCAENHLKLYKSIL